MYAFIFFCVLVLMDVCVCVLGFLFMAVGVMAWVRVGLEDEEIMVRMTGCPNGCARPYMSELAFVGDGPDSYQVCTCCYASFILLLSIT